MKFKVGQRYRVDNTSVFENNNVIEITSISNTTVFYRTIKGRNPINPYFNIGSLFAEKLVPIQQKKIVIMTDGVTTTAKLLEGKQVIKTAEAKCFSGDKFDFNLGATIALSRLTGLEKKVESNAMNWNKFGNGELFVLVTKDNLKHFVSEAKKHGFKFAPNEDFNPFHATVDLVIRLVMPNVTIKPNEIYINYDCNSGTLKVTHFIFDHEEYVWA